MRMRYGFVCTIVIAGTCLSTVSLGLGVATTAQKVKVWVSSNGGERMSAKEDREFGAAGGDAAKATFSINGAVKHQRMDGFGASIMEAGLMTLNTLPAEKQEEVLRSLFDREGGRGIHGDEDAAGGDGFSVGGAVVYV